MASNKYIYNKNTLRYEKTKAPQRQLFLQILGLVILFGVLTFSVYLLARGNSNVQKIQEQELTEMKARYVEMTVQLELMEEALANLHERDAAIYRQVLELNPTDEAFWDGGRGGSDKYEDLRDLTDDELLAALSDRIEKMKQRLAAMADAQEQILAAAQEKEKMLKAIPSIRPVRKLGRKIEYLSGFGYRKHPIFKFLKMHTGIDFGAPTGTAIYATGHGKVVKLVHKKDGYGKHIVIDHGFGYKSLYAHLSKIDVRVGQKVKRGEIIGRVGSTGTSTAPHLHYEIIRKNKKINPLPFCRDGLSNKEYKKFVQLANKQNKALSIN